MEEETWLGGNPFAVLSPEGLLAHDVVDLFVREVPGVDTIKAPGHSLLVGSRGSGKTMILRYMEPDCQKLWHPHAVANGAAIHLREIDFYAAYLTIKHTDLSYPQLKISPKSHENLAINEHFLVLSIILKILSRAIHNKTILDLDENLPSDLLFRLKGIIQRVQFGDGTPGLALNSSSNTTTREAFSILVSIYERIFDLSSDYLFGVAKDRNLLRYDGALLRFSNSLLPLLEWWNDLPGMPHRKQFYILIDDADRLSTIQTQILNSWISRRLPGISIKVASELYEYKTFSTLGTGRIETPHDYSEVNLTDVYTFSRAEFYRTRLKNMVERRLKSLTSVAARETKLGAMEFFPEDPNQLTKIEQIISDFKAGRRGKSSSRVRDDAYRYARPEYMLGLAGKSKNRSKYSYSGFNQLVNISSGVPRHFLECAYKMYERQAGRATSSNFIYHISPDIQDTVVREAAEAIFTKEIESLRYDTAPADSNPRYALFLHNLIKCLGSLFESIVLDARLSERRIFSVAISDQLDKETSAVFRMGIKNGYFVRSTIGRKEGIGRTELFVLTRRIAPYFNLDPNGYSAYKFMLTEQIRSMMYNPDNFLKRLRAEKAQIKRNGSVASEDDLLSYLVDEDDARSS